MRGEFNSELDKYMGALCLSFTNRSFQRRCSQYWPNEGIETFGDLTVKLVSEKKRGHYVERRLQVSQIKKVSMLAARQFKFKYTARN